MTQTTNPTAALLFATLLLVIALLAAACTEKSPDDVSADRAVADAGQSQERAEPASSTDTARQSIEDGASLCFTEEPLGVDAGNDDHRLRRFGFKPRWNPNSVGARYAARRARGPRNALQELNELLVETNKFTFRFRPPDHQRLREIEERRAEIHANELGDLQEVANRAALWGYVEEESDALGMSAVATRDIAAGELLLFNADSVFRTTGARFEPLATTYVGWYFRPDQEIPKGRKFSVECIQDAPEEIWNVENHYMPHSDRARDPERAYRTTIHFP